jgi:hypothetical protein
MNKLQLSGAVLAVGAAALFAAAPTFAQEEVVAGADVQMERKSSANANGCQGKGGCGSPGPHYQGSQAKAAEE